MDAQWGQSLLGRVDPLGFPAVKHQGHWDFSVALSVAPLGVVRELQNRRK